MTVNAASHFKNFAVAIGLVLLAGPGCRKPGPTGALVLTQSPVAAAAMMAVDDLDSQYPPGSRIVLMETPFSPERVQVLSGGLTAAGEPVVSYDGRTIFFAGKAGATDEWQIYQEDLADRSPQKLTSLPGGAMNPTLLSDGRVVFASPVPKIGGTNSGQTVSALYVQSPGGQPRRLTFSSCAISDPTMLSDGRILFVSTQPAESSNPVSGPALFTINNDGTEITAFAAAAAPGSVIQRPRPLADDRIVYLVSKSGSDSSGGSAEFVRTARPFQSRAPLFPEGTVRIRSLESASNGDLLVCAGTTTGTPTSSPLFALFRVSPSATSLGLPLLTDPAWNACEAVEVARRPAPMGRLSTMDLTKSTGKILCLDANFSGDPATGTTAAATRVRVLAEMSPGNVCMLGEVPVQGDGSFLAEVPADVPLGFEALDATGRVLRREAPMLWVRPAENRSCIGCHEPHNRSPHNHRPLAVSVPITWLGPKNTGPAPTKSN